MTDWNRYWGGKGIKKGLIEFVRKHYFAPLFGRTVLRYIKGQGPILEAGCGSGEISLFLKNRGCNVVCLDIEISAVETARKKSLNAVVGDIHKTPFPDNSFELVFNQGVMEHFGFMEIEEILKEFSRISSKVLLIVPSDISIFRIYNPFDVDDARFYSPGEMGEIIGRVYRKVEARYIHGSFGISLMVYGEGKK